MVEEETLCDGDPPEALGSADHPFLDPLLSPHFCGFPFTSLAAPFTWLLLLQPTFKHWILKLCFSLF